MEDFGFGYDSQEDYNGGYGGSDLASTLIGVGGSLAQTAILANANPTNTALLTGQGVSTPTLQTTGVPTSVNMGFSGTGLLFVIVAGVVLFFLVRG